MSDQQSRVTRHRLADRLYHWSMAVCVLVLLATGFLPILGIQFAWVDPHWIAGVTLTLLVALHIVRALFFLTPSNIRIRWREFRGSAIAKTKEALGGPRLDQPRRIRAASRSGTLAEIADLL